MDYHSWKGNKTLNISNPHYLPHGWLNATLSLIKLKGRNLPTVAGIGFRKSGTEPKYCYRIKCQKSSLIVDIWFTVPGYD